MKFEQHQLENGLQIIAECNAHAYSNSLAFFVNTGARDESTEVAGVSHFLEHMVFKGTPNHSADEVNRRLDELGSHSNAFTSEEQTVYYATVLPEYQTEVVSLLADLMRPSLREDDFESEKKVIIEEIYKYEDQPPFGAMEKCMEAYFEGHPLGNNVLGTVDTVSALSPEQMREYLLRRYSPGNMTLVACGNVDFPALIAAAEEHCSEWQPFSTDRSLSDSQGRSGRQRISNEQATQEYSVVISPGPAAADKRRFAARLLAYVMGDEGGSRYFWDLVDTGRAEFACSTPYEFDGAGIMMSYLCCGPDEAESNLSRMRAIQEELQSNGISDEELELAKSKVCSQLVRRSERPANRLFAVGNSWLLRNSYSTVKEVIDSYRAVSLESIREVLDAFPLDESMVVSVGPTT